MIIGFSGKMGTGKTTLATYLSQRLEDHAVDVWYTSFGDTMKEVVSGAYRLPLIAFHDVARKDTPFPVTDIPNTVHSELILPEWKERGTVTPRELMQWYATDYIRRESPNFWVERTAEQIYSWMVRREKTTADICIVCIDDVRFPNELDFVRKNGLCYRILPYPEWKEGERGKHVSETALDAEEWDEKYVLSPEWGKLPEVGEAIFEKLWTQIRGRV